MKTNSTRVLLLSLSTAFLLSGCGSDDTETITESNNINSTTRFEAVSMMGDTVERDNQSKLEWVGSAGSMNTACSPHGAATTEVPTQN